MKTTRSLLAAAVLLAAALPASDAAAAKKARSEAIYEVTFNAQMKDEWQAHFYSTDDCQLTGALCVRDEKGGGTATLNVSTGQPFKMLVMRGVRGRGPQINVGTGEGAPVSGPYKRTGSWTTEYSGPWDAANPDRKAEDKGCGAKTIKGDINFTWRGRNQLGLSPILDDDREDCPTGPGEGWEWDGGESPSLSAVLAQVSQTSKFLKTKQFTVRGAKTWTGKIPPFSRQGKHGQYTKNGTRKTTWQWEATFRMKKGR